MAARSKAKRLGAELRTELDRLLQENRLTQREIAEHLRGLGADISKSAVGRYALEFERVAADIRMTREMARAVGTELGEGEDATRVLVESLHALLLRARMQLADQDSIETRAVADLARAVKDLQSAFRSSTEGELKLRAAVAREAAAAVEETAVAQGLSTETVEAIKARILGVAQR